MALRADRQRARLAARASARTYVELSTRAACCFGLWRRRSPDVLSAVVRLEPWLSEPAVNWLSCDCSLDCDRDMPAVEGLADMAGAESTTLAARPP